MLRNSSFLALGLGLLAPLALAHDTLPARWCADPNANPIVTNSFNFTPDMLMAYREAHLADDSVLGGTCAPLKSCGIVDDWFWANQMAHEYCGGSLQQRNSSALTTQSHSVMPLVSAPGNFNLTGDEDHNGIADHHDRYRFSDGNLIGVCVACPPVREAPSPVPAEVKR